MVPLFKVATDVEKVLIEVENVLRSGWVGEGPKVSQVEDLFHNHLGSKIKPLGTNSCTSALTIAYRLAGVGPGDRCLTTPTTCSASNIPILNLGAIPVWVDCDPLSGNMDLEDLKRAIQEYPEAKCVTVVHWGGSSVNVEAVREIAGSRFIIEDAAHCFNSFYPNGRKVGDSDNLCCFSCQAIKFWNCSDGGFLVTRTSEERERARKLRWYGLDRESRRMDQDLLEDGYKANMCDTDAAVLIANFDMALKNCELHKQHAKLLWELSSKSFPNYDSNSSSWLFTSITKNPNRLQKNLSLAGFVSDQVHRRNDEMTLFKKRSINRPLPGVDKFYSQMLAVPGGWWVTEEQIKKIAEVLNL